MVYIRLIFFQKSVFVKAIFNVALLYIVTTKSWLSQMAQLSRDRRLWVTRRISNRSQSMPATVFDHRIHAQYLTAQSFFVPAGLIIVAVKMRVKAWFFSHNSSAQ